MHLVHRIRCVAHRAAFLACVAQALLALDAHAITPPDPSGVYEGQCQLGSASYYRCKERESTAGVRMPRMRIIATGFQEGVGDEPPRTTIEGQIELPRRYTWNGEWDEAAQRCNTFPDWPRVSETVEIFDYFGEITWNDLVPGAPYLENTISITSLRATPSPTVGCSHTNLEIEGDFWLIDQEPGGFSTTCGDLTGFPAFKIDYAVGPAGPNDPYIEGVPKRCGGGLTCAPELGRFYRWSTCFDRVIQGAAPEAKGSLSGTLRSMVPTLTETESEVHLARLVLYEQLSGPLRPQGPAESDQEYADFLRAAALEPVGAISIERRRDRSYTFDLPGAFEFDGVKIFRKLRESGRYGTVFYAIEVQGAETTEEEFDGSDDPIPGTDSTLYFRNRFFSNLRPEQDSQVLELDVFTGTGVKQVLIDRLTELCPDNYGPVEAGAQTYLDEIESGVRELTPAVDEAIARGVWAERAVLAGVQMADELIEVSLTGLGVVLADAWDDLTDFKSRKATSKAIRREKANGVDVDAAAAGTFDIDPGPASAALRDAWSGAGDIRERAIVAIAQQVKLSVKAMNPYLARLLGEAGVSDPDSVASLFTKALILLVDGFENGHVLGGTKPFVKGLIEAGVALGKPLLIDGGGTSYCALTDGSLQRTVTGMTGWLTQNEIKYEKDRRDTVAQISALNASASDVLARMRAAQEVAAGFDRAQDAFAVIGKVVKLGVLVEKFSLVAKYALNAESAVLPAAEAFAFTPAFVDQATIEAFGGFFLLEAARTPYARVEAPRARAVLAVQTDLDLQGAIDDLLAALADDRVGDAADQLSERTAGTYSFEDDAWARRAEDLMMVAGALRSPFPADWVTAIDRALEAWRAVTVTRAAAGEALGDFVLGVYAGDYTDTDDADYVVDRDELVTLLLAHSAVVAAATDALAALASDLAVADITPVVAISDVLVVSDATGLDTITATPESLTLSARVRNLSDASIAGVSAIAVVTSPKGSTTVMTAQLPAGSGMLSPDDGVDGAGTDEAVVEWRLDYAGDLGGEEIVVQIQALENGGEPADFATTGALAFLSVDASVADQDLDGMPDDVEQARGLDPNVDDSGADLDDDGIANLTELDGGTRPDLADTDGDGLDDGEEITPGADGWVTDPLDDDTDDDGVLDGADQSPTDGSTADATTPPGEPQVEVSESLVVLTDSQPYAAVTVTNAAEGILGWSAESQSAALIETSPGAGDIGSDGQVLFLATPDGFDSTQVGLVTAEVDVVDVSGAVSDRRTITVLLGGDAVVALCGHPTNGSIGGRPTATDGLVSLQAAVGLLPCAVCRCDVDASDSVTATDALKILQAAVGLAVALVCPGC